MSFGMLPTIVEIVAHVIRILPRLHESLPVKIKLENCRHFELVVLCHCILVVVINLPSENILLIFDSLNLIVRLYHFWAIIFSGLSCPGCLANS